MIWILKLHIVIISLLDYLINYELENVFTDSYGLLHQYIIYTLKVNSF